MNFSLSKRKIYSSRSTANCCNFPEKPPEGGLQKLKTHLVNTIQNNRIQRDIFGLNPVIKDMQTAVIVAEEIGMKRASILGLMLHDSVRCGTCTALEVEQIYGEDVAGIIRD